MQEGKKCALCDGTGFQLIKDENGVEFAKTCICHPAVQKRKVKEGAGKYSWAAVMRKKYNDSGYCARG